MFKQLIPTVVLSLTCALLSMPVSAGPGKGGKGGMMGDGPIAFILEHGKDLNLTADQIKSLEALKEKVAAAVEKAMQDPEVRKIMQEMRDARKSGDKDKMQSLREELQGLRQKDGAGEKLFGALKDILNADQLSKLKELRQESGKGLGAGRAGGKGETTSTGERPDPSKGPPPVFDGDKKPATSF